MNTEKDLTIDIQKTAKRIYDKELSANDQNKIAKEIISDDEFSKIYEMKIVEYVGKFFNNKKESPLIDIYTLKEAAEAWSMTESNLRNYLNRFNSFDDQKKRGLVKKSFGTWIITHKAMFEVFGAPPEKEEKETEG